MNKVYFKRLDFRRLRGSRFVCSMLYLNSKRLAILGGLFFLTSSLSHTEEKKLHWRLLIEPSFAYPPIAWPIAGARQTVIVPAYVVHGIPVYLTPEKQHGLSRQQIEESALKNASQTLAKLQPKFLRDEQGVILYAVLESDQPWTASSVLAPEFEKLFADIMGSDFLIAIPNRFRVYVFPRLFAPMARIAEDIAIDFRANAYPVTKEVFTLHKGTLSCVGVLER